MPTSSHRLSALEAAATQADSGAPLTLPRCYVTARCPLGSRYVPVCVRCGPQRGPEAVSGTIHAHDDCFIPVSLWGKKTTRQVCHSLGSPSASKAHGVLSASDLPTRHCAKLWTVRKATEADKRHGTTTNRYDGGTLVIVTQVLHVLTRILFN